MKSCIVVFLLQLHVQKYSLLVRYVAQVYVKDLLGKVGYDFKLPGKFVKTCIISLYIYTSCSVRKYRTSRLQF